MIARAWFFVAGVLVGAGSVLFYFMHHYDVKLVPAPQSHVSQPSTVAPPVTPAPQRATLPPKAPAATPSTPLQPAPAAPTPPLAAPAAPVTAPQSSISPPGNLLIPVRGIQPAELADTFNQIRGGTRIHEALDIMAPRGREIVAVEDGKVAKIFTSKQGGLTFYQFDPTERFTYYYAHLDRYAPGLVEGKPLKRGELVGYVGSTGNANPDAPHLHFAIFELGPEKRWWEGRPINPYPLLQGVPAPNS